MVDVIAQFLRASGFCFTVAITVGDKGLAIFSERCIDGWYQSGQKPKPLDARIHDLSDASFIVEVNSLPNQVADFYHNGPSMQTDEGSTHIRLTQGTIYIKGDIVHEGNTNHTGNTNQQGSMQLNGMYTKNGGWTQFGGEAVAAGTLTAAKLVGGGIYLETDVHIETGEIMKKPQK